MEAPTERSTVAGRPVGSGYFVTDLSLREEANRQFERLFAAPRPARTFVEVSGLPYGATVEIDAGAAVRTRG